MICQRCQTENPIEASYCRNCGASLALYCTNCQANLAADARFCMYCGQAVRVRTADDEARHSRLAAAAPQSLVEKVRTAVISGERRVVTVLFADVVGSTALAETIDLEKWSSLMNGAFDRITPAIYRYEGTIAHLLGDSMVAFFGAPIAHEDDPLRAVHAALDSLESIQNYASEVNRIFGLDFAMRFCLNTGPVVIGPIGSDMRYDYSATGGAVNLAARLKFSTRPMSVMISENTHRFIAPYFETQNLGSIEVKDLPEPVRVYQVVQPKAEPGTLRGLVGLSSPLVGRDQEFGALMRMYEAVRSGLGRAALVTGEPGLGKTRLIAEWQAAIARSQNTPAPQWIEGRCLSYGQGMAYHLVLDLLRSLLGLPITAIEADLHSGLLNVVCDLFGGSPTNLSPQGQEIYPFLGHLLAVDLESEAQEALQRLDPQALQAHYQSAMRQLLQALASRRPLIVVLEDLHWADPSSADMLIRILPIVLSARVLICLVTRPEVDVPGARLVASARELLGKSLTEITLETLSEKYSRQLIANLLAIEALPDALRDLILQKSEGNPFFVEEIIRMLIERRAIIRKGEGWIAGEGLREMEIPDNLQGLLLARIDRLSDESKQALRVASVVGRQFPVKVLNQVLGQTVQNETTAAEDTMITLSNLESAGLIRIAQIEPDLEYLFHHNLIQEAAYTSLLVTDRKRLHLVVGETVERLYPDKLGSREFAPRLGEHFAEAGDDQRALKYYQLAGEAALASYSNGEAEDNYRRGLSLACTPDQRAELLAGFGEALNGLSRFEEAIAVWREAIDIYEQLGNRAAMARLYARAGRAAWWAGATPLGLQICQQGLQAVQGASDSPEIAMLIHEIARAYYFNGASDKARVHCQQALEIADRLGAVEVQADTLATLGVLRSLTPDESIAALTRSVELAETHGLLISANRAHANLGTMIINYKGDLLTARGHFQRALEIAQQRGVIQEILFCKVNVVGVSGEMGELDTLERFLADYKELSREMPESVMARSEINSFQAWLFSMRGNWQDALLLISELRKEARQRGDLQNLLNHDYALANCYKELRRFGEQVDIIEFETVLLEALDISQRGFGSLIPPLCILAILRMYQNRLPEAHQTLQQAHQSKNYQMAFWDGVYLDLAKAFLATAESRWEEAFAAFEAAVDQMSSAGYLWTHATTLMDWADALAQRGEPADLERARAMLREAGAMFERMGCAVYLQLIESKRQDLREKSLAQAVLRGEVVQEMAQARRVQKSFLPEEPPRLPGWQMAALLEPIRETSGDYYDFIQLPEDRLGIVVADVADKGAAAALFMTSSRSLIRAFAEEYPDDPAKVIFSANHRLVKDTREGLFVTIFYGVLNLTTGNLSYCNGGHNPPYLLDSQSGELKERLVKTGIPMGIQEDSSWSTGSVDIFSGDVLLFYTDGVTELQNDQGEFYGEHHLLKSIRANLSKYPIVSIYAQVILDDLMVSIRQFLGNTPRSDDLTLLVLVRDLVPPLND